MAILAAQCLWTCPIGSRACQSGLVFHFSQSKAGDTGCYIIEPTLNRKQVAQLQADCAGCVRAKHIESMDVTLMIV